MPTLYAPWQKELLIAVEATPGTPGTAIWKDECRTSTPSWNQTIEDEQGYLGVPATHYDSIEYQHHSEGGVLLPFRTSGVAANLLGSMCGVGSETTTGASDPYTHTFVTSPTAVRTPTFTIWDSFGDNTSVERKVYCALSSVHLTGNPSGAVTCDVAYTGKWPTQVARPTPTVYVGNTANYLKTTLPGNGLTLTLYDSSGAAYTCNVLTVDLTITRPVEPVPNPSGKDPADIVVGPISMTGTIDFQFDGGVAHTLYNDFLNNKILGDSGHVHSLAWTDADSPAHSCTINFWPLRLSSFTRNDGSTYVTGQVTLQPFQDLASANNASPVITLLKSVVVTNKITTNMMV